MTSDRWQISRRAFGRLAFGLTAILAQGLSNLGCGPHAPPSNDPFNKPEPPLPACSIPDTDEARTLEAFCETCIPGRKTDPTQKPGAVEACAVALFYDPELPAAPLVPLIVGLINDKSQELFKKQFVALSPDQQIQAIDDLDRKIEIFGFAIQLVRLAFYSSEIAAYQLRYPGANSGYATHPNFSFRRPMAQEISTDGNLL